jgi:hypothetical protein
MDRYITGLWTQRNPLRDADVPYLYGKYYSATRFDSIIDGINREITARLTLARRPGLSVFNSNIFPRVNSFYAFKYLLNNVQQVHTIVDTASTIYDATGNGQVNLFTKAAGAGKARFLGVGNTLYIGDGVDRKKWLRPTTQWTANTSFTAGTFIIDTNGNLQVATAPSPQFNNTQIAVNYTTLGTGITRNITITTASNVQVIGASAVTLAGLTHHPEFNGTYSTPQAAIVQSGPNTFAIRNTVLVAGTDILTTFETGTSSFTRATGVGNGITGSTQPTWNATVGGSTVDGGVIWVNQGVPLYNWGIAAPTAGFIVASSGHFWRPNFLASLWNSVLDSNGNVQTIVGNPGPGTATGASQPVWNKSLGGFTFDGAFQWQNIGSILSWQPNTIMPFSQAILDSNGNLEYASTVVSPGLTGSTQPTWNTGLGNVVSDNDVTWRNVGAGVVLANGSVTYCYAYHSVDGSVSTASPLAVIPNGILGVNGQYAVQLTGNGTADPQCDQIWIYRTAQGGATPILLAKIPNPSVGVAGIFSFTDTLPDSALNPFIQAPLANAADTPPAGATAPEYHNQRIWIIVGNTVYYSAGPDTAAFASNGNTAFPPLNSFVFPETITKLRAITTNNGGLLVEGTANVYIVLGNGTSSNPYYTQVYMPTVGLLNYDAETIVGSTVYMLTNNSKAVSLDPSAGYTEIGAPIGDQFQFVSTGGIAPQAFYDPTTAYVTWHEKTSGDSAIYVADSHVGWFRYSPIATPESGFLWSPRAAIEGGTSAVQSIETATGIMNLLVGPFSNGPILVRDINRFNDNGTVYSKSYTTIGSLSLCESGEVAEVAHIALVSMRVGARPTVGMLYGEIAETTNVKFDELIYTSVDPPTLDEAETLYSDRYVTSQDGVTPKCDHCQIRITWPPQSVADELLTHTLYGAKFSERRQAN